MTDLIVIGGGLAGKSASAATFMRCRLTSKRDTRRNAVRPARKPSALVCQPRPSAVRIPAPVMTTGEELRGRELAGKSMMIQRQGNAAARSRKARENGGGAGLAGAPRGVGIWAWASNCMARRERRYRACGCGATRKADRNEPLERIVDYQRLARIIVQGF